MGHQDDVYINDPDDDLNVGNNGGDGGNGGGMMQYLNNMFGWGANN